MHTTESVILLDVPRGEPDFDRSVLKGMGHQVRVCHGPESGSLCPLLTQGGDCSKLSGAHGIMFELDLDRSQHQAILKRYQQVVPSGVPIRVLVTPEQLEHYQELLAGVEVWTHEPTVGDLDAFSARVEGFERVSTED